MYTRRLKVFHSKNADELTEAEIRVLLSKKLHSTHQKRLQRFRRTGRLIGLVPNNYPLTLESLSSKQMNEGQGVVCGRLRWGRIRSNARFLLLIEVVAVVGFVYLVINGIRLHHGLNRTMAVAQKLPTLTPTPLISAIALPSGHVHASSNESQPMKAEIPEHLRPLVQSQTDLSIPTPAPLHGIRIQIPAIDVDAPIVHGDGWEQLKKGVAHRADSANPGQPGNIVLSGHNDIFGEVFRYLERLKPGDEIIVYTSQRAFTYVVSGWELVEPTQVEVMAPTPDATITLISCHPYLVDTHRIVVKGSLAG